MKLAYFFALYSLLCDVMVDTRELIKPYMFSGRSNGDRIIKGEFNVVALIFIHFWT